MGKFNGLKQKFRTSIKLQIVQYVLQSLVLCLLCFMVLGILFRMISAQTIEPRNAERHLAAGIASYQEYISENGISSTDMAMAYGWTDGVVIVLPEDSHLSAHEYGKRMLQSAVEIAYADGTASATFVYLIDETAYAWGMLVVTLIAAAVFFSRFYFLLKRKLNYITEIEQGVHILESGDLSYQLKVTGEDELSRLAVSINEMSQSLTGRIELEQKALLSEREMIGDLSHDIRTPLTILSGYIPLLLESEGLSDTQRQHLEVMNRKTEQMRKRVDELLDYATIYSGQRKPQMHTLQAAGLVQQFIAELALFNPVITSEISAEARISADPSLLERVFDNLISNLHKHADLEQPIQLSCREDDGSVIIALENATHESTASDGKTMGNKIVAYIMQLHGGAMAISQQDGRYRVTLAFPVKN